MGRLSEPFHLFDPVLQDAHDGLRPDQRGQPVRSRLDLRGLDCQKHKISRPNDLLLARANRAEDADRAAVFQQRQVIAGSPSTQ